MSQKQKITLLIILNILIFSLLGFLTWQTVGIYKILKSRPNFVQTETNVSSHKRITGAVTYEAVTDNPRDPQIMEVKVDPFDVKMGETQVVTVKVKSSSSEMTNADYVKGIAITDNKSVDFSLELIEAERGEDGLISTWQGSWEREDSVDSKFQIKIIAHTQKGQDKATLSFK